MANRRKSLPHDPLVQYNARLRMSDIKLISSQPEGGSACLRRLCDMLRDNKDAEIEKIDKRLQELKIEETILIDRRTELITEKETQQKDDADREGHKQAATNTLKKHTRDKNFIKYCRTQAEDRNKKLAGRRILPFTPDELKDAAILAAKIEGAET